MATRDGRNKPKLTVTIEADHMAWLLRLHRHSGLSVSRIVREVIVLAQRSGYKPGSVPISVLRDEALRGTGV